MQNSTPIIDLHVHSSLKPYGNSFYSNTKIYDYTDPACIWFNDRRARTDNLFEEILGICRYRQSDFLSLALGQIKIAFVSLYPVEKEFFDIRDGNFMKRFEILLAEFASMLGKKRISNIREHNFDYFKDLCKEYSFLRRLHGEDIPVGGYYMPQSAAHLTQKANLLIIPSIEGCHALCNGKDPRNPSAWDSIEDNIAVIKSWPSPPLFVTFAHHFYNGLCTHAKSLFNMSGKLLDQEFGMREHKWEHSDGLPPISTIGKKVLQLLLSRTNGRRILIDVKHMSLEARREYYKMLANEYSSENIPVIWSHGALNLNNDKCEINMFLDTDVSVIYKTSGLIGIEMDQRILGYDNNRFWKKLRSILRPRHKAYYEAAYFWKQVITIAEYAYTTGYDDPWECIALGSDYDGIINPLNSYPDASSLSILYQYLVVYLTEYWEGPSPVIPKKISGPDAADIVYRIMYKNAFEFINKHYL
ncbi:MAG TPA: membrane dipeptidase [Flavobacterium sp.]|jgi:hypothetical protein